VVDDFTRECLALVADTSLSGARVARGLTARIGQQGKPLMMVSDNGTDLTSPVILRWLQDHWVGVALHRAGQAGAERVRREPKWPAAGRVPQ
jgi:transposase InsO family protein